ncbi:pilus assembly protein PilM [Pectobacteriaceae bacterium CE70]|uniref:Pilus assembly protein HofM n=1 Tax=Serratia sp. (strain ATCC 39006) TaxID=104623 RepID=A0A2I5TDX2_SERS3|nr:MULTISPECIES: pilus assembly protein PilM [Enterobacterales]WJV62913.1 pilus assembly protein PilM [Pectobacteriaceae bacterium C52]WJV67253.1 pilus assembly protein PilM [Pectobacteriaceae bacterium CE70]WJY11234.1 pilus assembly protein PilM [Pectobacteriaceae bacterium C80]AUG98452.1 pilus assembly protein HofM [Serratia sp. ATCC 39006]AUH02767.1 pilus assembly protein HofM [Serratia sp. ATCC 39006]
MAYHIWQVGVDIQNGCMRALAVQRCRHGWQLRHWWQFPLPGDTLRLGSLYHADGLCEILRQWRRELPRFISLRVGFPASQILQQRLPQPDKRLREPARGEYIEKMALRKLPVSRDMLALDYRTDPQIADTLLVTAARNAELVAWQDCFSQSGLEPEVMDITPCALRCMAQQAGLLSERLLLHRFDDHWLWTSPLNHPLHFGTFQPEDITDKQALISHLSTCYQMATEEPVYCSSSIADDLSGMSEMLISWSPLVAFHQQHPPLPPMPSAFVIAGGLALRPGDTY